MTKHAFVLPVLVLGLAAAALAQDATAPSPAPPAPQLRVIVPWTHFGQAPSSAGANPAAPGGTSPSPDTVAPENAAMPASSDPATGPSAPAVPPSDQTSAEALGPAEGTQNPPSSQAPSATGAQAGQLDSQAQVYEADISKKHPHPPEPVTLPAAVENAPPLITVSPNEAVPAPPGLTPVPVLQSDATGPKPAPAASSSTTPESDIAAVSEAYEARRASRESKLSELRAAGSKDPAGEIEETRLELEGEQDRMKTAEQLARDFAELSDELHQRAVKVTALVNDRKQIVSSSEAELDQLNGLDPRRELALRNLAQLPASAENDQTIEGLQSELGEDSSTRKLATERKQEARNEVAALESEANELEQAAAKAREKSAAYAAASEQARSNEDRLADRMEYVEARERAADLLASSSKILEKSAPLAADVTAAPATPAPAPSAAAPARENAAGSLRECIRKTGNVDACLAQGGGQ